MAGSNSNYSGRFIKLDLETPRVCADCRRSHERTVEYWFGAYCVVCAVRRAVANGLPYVVMYELRGLAWADARANPKRAKDESEFHGPTCRYYKWLADGGRSDREILNLLCGCL